MSSSPIIRWPIPDVAERKLIEIAFAIEPFAEG
jgi:hypothetical protein